MSSAKWWPFRFGPHLITCILLLIWKRTHVFEERQLKSNQFFTLIEISIFSVWIGDLINRNYHFQQPKIIQYLPDSLPDRIPIISSFTKQVPWMGVAVRSYYQLNHAIKDWVSTYLNKWHQDSVVYFVKDVNPNFDSSLTKLPRKNRPQTCIEELVRLTGRMYMVPDIIESDLQIRYNWHWHNWYLYHPSRPAIQLLLLWTLQSQVIHHLECYRDELIPGNLPN